MNAGMLIRYKRIWGRDGRTFILPFDHGSSSGIIDGLENIDQIIDIANLYADAIMLRPGLMNKVSKTLHKKIGIILCLTGRLYRGVDHVQINSVEEAIRNGADAICVEYKVGSENDLENLAQASRLIESAHRYNIPALVTSYPQKSYVEYAGERAYIDICRIAEEIGGDFIKTNIPNNAEIIAKCKCATSLPIIVAGGENNSTNFETDVKEMLKVDIDGFAFGRRIWGADDPYKMAKVLHDIVHQK